MLGTEGWRPFMFCLFSCSGGGYMLHVLSAVCYTYEYSCKYCCDKMFNVVKWTCYMFSLPSVTLMNIHVNNITCCGKLCIATCNMFSLQSVTHMNIHDNIVMTKCSMMSNERVTCSLCRLLHLGIFMEILSHVVANCANCKCYMFSLQSVTIMNIHVNIHLYHMVTNCSKL